jgi:hypothetical protein
MRLVLTNVSGVDRHTITPGRLDSERNGNIVLYLFSSWEMVMLKLFAEEVAALASLTLFVGMIAVWAQVIPQL